MPEITTSDQAPLVGAGILFYSVDPTTKEKRLLLHSRPTGKKAGFLVDIGGATEEGETALTTACREYAEESLGWIWPEKFRHLPDSQERQHEAERYVREEIILQQRQQPFVTENGFAIYSVFCVHVNQFDLSDVNPLFQAQPKQRLFQWVSASDITNNKVPPLHPRLNGMALNNWIAERTELKSAL
eukprot:TRINITY_DN68055_c9_g9_i1.p1 TRINITY_DN68055_c9_g9~~TRINITY_DN68055_c9_g9_i1.p1  ORF type:complete len:186 (-),score=8.91 TRINITY_DN68055_c9_g9_i1:850-1407(-)